MLIHIGYRKTGATWLQHLARSEAGGLAMARGDPFHQIEGNIVRPPALERRPRRAFERRPDAGRRGQIAAHGGDSDAESKRRTGALTGLPLANRSPFVGRI